MGVFKGGLSYIKVIFNIKKCLDLANLYDTIFATLVPPNPMQYLAMTHKVREQKFGGGMTNGHGQLKQQMGNPFLMDEGKKFNTINALHRTNGSQEGRH